MEKYKEIISLLDNELKNIKEEKEQLEFNITNFGKKRVRDFESAKDFAAEKAKMDKAEEKIAALIAKATIVDGFCKEAKSIEAEYNEAKNSLNAAKLIPTNRKSRDKVIEYFEKELELVKGVAETKLNILEENIKNIDSLTEKVTTKAKAKTETKKTAKLAKVIKTTEAPKSLAKKSKKTAIVATSIILATAMLCGTAIYTIKSLVKKDKANTINNNNVTGSYEIINNTPEVTSEITVTPTPTLSPEEEKALENDLIANNINQLYKNIVANDSDSFKFEFDEKAINNIVMFGLKDYEQLLPLLDETTQNDKMLLWNEIKEYYFVNIMDPIISMYNARWDKVQANFKKDAGYSFERIGFAEALTNQYAKSLRGLETLKYFEDLSLRLENETAIKDSENFDKIATEAMEAILVVFPFNSNVLKNGDALTTYNTMDPMVQHLVYMTADHILCVICGKDRTFKVEYPDLVAPCYTAGSLRNHINTIRPLNKGPKPQDFDGSDLPSGETDDNDNCYYADNAADKITTEAFKGLMKLAKQVELENKDANKLTLG